MRYFLFIPLLLLIGCPAKGETVKTACKVIAVSDGDTLTCINNQSGKTTQIKVRLIYIDAPEKGQAFGASSKKLLSDMVYKRDITLIIHGNDKYGRTLGEVLHGNINVNQRMVQHGMAWAYREYKPEQSYIDFENHAKSQKIGLWSEPNPIKPSDWRRQQRHKQ